MIPTRKQADDELEKANRLNPGPWKEHSINVGRAAEIIAQHCSDMDSEKAYIVGCLHDIGRRVGIVGVKHIIAGYDYAMKKGWDEVARVCLTHSYPMQDTSKDIGKYDITVDEYNRMNNILNSMVYDDYDKLIILCDSLAMAEGFVILEKRFVDTTRRYGVFDFTVERWNSVIAIKEYFENKMGCLIYDILPNIKETTFKI